MEKVFILFIVFTFIFQIRCHKEKSEVPKLLMISFDGFRYDYVRKAEDHGKNVTAFKKMMETGVHAGYVEGVFTSVTFPSHTSIVSGMYEESHGIVDNDYFDPKFNATFRSSNLKDNLDPKWWNTGYEPIWITNERQGHDSAVINYPGMSVRYNGYIQTYSNFIFNAYVPWNYYVDLMFGWLLKDHTSLGILYHREPDATGHQYGPDSQQMLDQIEKANERLSYVLEKMEASHQLRHNLNIMLVSDHGMAQLSKNRSIDVSNFIPQDWYHSYSRIGFALWGLWPKKDKVDVILETLKGKQHMKVWKREEVPSVFHYSNNRRIPPIVILAEDRWQLRTSSDTRNYTGGTHGYNNSLSDMHPIFMAVGPAFKRGFKVDKVNMVDYYSLMCKILGLVPHPNNGSLERIQSVLEAHEEDESITSTFVTFLICFLVAGSMSGIYCIAACLHGRTSRWQSIPKRRNQGLDAIYVSDTSRVRLMGKATTGINSTVDELFSDDDDDSI